MFCRITADGKLLLNPCQGGVVVVRLMWQDPPSLCTNGACGRVKTDIKTVDYRYIFIQYEGYIPL